MNKLLVVGGVAFAYYWWGQQVIDWFTSISVTTWVLISLILFFLLFVAGGVASALKRRDVIKWERQLEADRKIRVAQAPQAPIYMLPHPGMGVNQGSKPSATYTALPPERYELL